MSLPTRLFKLYPTVVRSASESFDVEKIALGEIVNGNVLRSCNYCIVSHVWGPTPPVIQVKGIPWDVPISSKQKFIFLLKACERRGYEYAWIDFLCVDQDSSEDKDNEIPNLCQYYKNAHATIVLGSSWKDFASQWAKVGNRIREWNEDWNKVIHVDWDGFAEVDALINDGWFWRIWTLQETVIPLTTAPGTTLDPAPYSPTRLLTSDGGLMDLRGLCDMIDWSYIALAKLDYNPDVGKYPWIHPGAGVVNEHGRWWMVALLKEAVDHSRPLHPIQAMTITRFRDTSYPSDRLRGIYALIDSTWYSTIVRTKDLYQQLADKYIEKKEGALLLTMGVYEPEQLKGTWAAGVSPDSKFGSVVPIGGKYPLISATINSDRSLSLTAAGIANVTTYGTKPYGDGSGELMTLIRDLYDLQHTRNIDIASIVTLLKLAITKSRIKLDHTIHSIDDIKSLIHASISNANAVSSALRIVFSGWDRWIFFYSDTAILAWLPSKKSDPSLPYSLLWVTRDIVNEWAVIVDGDMQAGFKKVGVAFVNSKPSGKETDVVIL